MAELTPHAACVGLVRAPQHAHRRVHECKDRPQLRLPLRCQTHLD